MAVVLLASGCTKSGPPVPAPFSLDDTLTLRAACSQISAHLHSALGSCADTSASGLFYRTLDRAAGAIIKPVSDTTAGRDALSAVLNTVYGSWEIGFDPRDTAAETLLPHLVFKHRNGSCLGVSLVILLLAEKLDLPVYGVMVPGHFFCRYDDGRTRINIEPNRKGYAHPDDYYLKRYPLERRPGYSLANLDNGAVIGVLCYNAGALCLRRKLHDAAVGYYREAVRRIPGFAEAKGNLAVAFAKGGNLDTALVLFDELFTAHPDMANLAANYGYVAAAAKKTSKAIDIYKKGLEYFPGDTTLRERIEKISFKLDLFMENKKKE